MLQIVELKRRKTMKKSGRVTSRTDKTIAIRVKALMEAGDWDQKDLATKLELSEGYISRILSGERPWPISLVFRTAEVFDVPVSDVDPELESILRKEIEEMELRRDIPHLKVLYTFIQSLPKILDPDDLNALERVLLAFSEKSTNQ